MIKQQFEFSGIEIPGVVLIKPFITEDDRGSVIKEYSMQILSDKGINFEPLETLNIHSKKNVLRGLHFQRIEWQSKLIHCISGKIWGVIVDLRVGSGAFGKWYAIELDQTLELYIPLGCAFGSLALEDTILNYACGTNFFNADYDDGICWHDPELNIDWPLSKHVVVSEKDKNLQSFRTYRNRVVK